MLTLTFLFGASIGIFVTAVFYEGEPKARRIVREVSERAAQFAPRCG